MNSKQFFFALNTDDTDEHLRIEEGFYREMWNMIPGNEFTSNPSRQNMKGNTLMSIDFTEAEDNICIGTATDNGRNRLIAFIHKPSGTDAIYLWVSGESSWTKLFEWSGLNFDPEYPVEHAYIISDLLYWCEKNNSQKCLNIKRALAGDYVGKEIEIELFKKGPIIPAVVVKTTANDTSISSNVIAFNNYHFSYRYKYKDGVYSDIAPYSKIMKSAARPDVNLIFRSANVTITIPKNLEHYVSEIEFLVETNKLGVWKVFATEKSIDTSLVQTITKNFTGVGLLRTLADSDTNQLFQPIPRRSSALVLMKNRSIINFNKDGYNSNGTYNIGISDIINDQDDTAEWATEFTAKNRQFHWKAGGRKTILLCFYDEYGRLTETRKTVDVSTPFEVYQETAFADEPYSVKKYLPSVLLSGNPPSQATHFGFALSEDQIYESYMQIASIVLFYVGEYNEGDTIDPGTFVYNNKIYLDAPPASFAASTASYIHLEMPVNLPFVPDSSYQIRMMNETGTLDTTLVEPIIEVVNGKMVIGNFEIDDWSFLTTDGTARIMVEVYKPKENVSEAFYEIGEIYPVSQFSGQFYLEGDANRVNGGTTQFKFQSISGQSQDFPTNAYTTDMLTNHVIFTESPSDTIAASNIDTSVDTVVNAESERTKELRSKSLVGNVLKGFVYIFRPPKYIFNSFRSLTKNASSTIDYSKIANNYGRTIVILEDEQELNMSNMIMSSDVFVADSKINGLHNFDVETAFVLPYDRGEIVKMVPANDVLVIVHERNITTMYPGESYVRQGEDFSWTITDNFLTQERKLMGAVGSQDPASIVEYDGRVYGLDRLNAEPWRRSNDGVTLLATELGVKRWFVEKCAQYKDADVDIVGGYDPYLDAYFLTFPAITGVEAVTIGFFEKSQKRERSYWVGFYDFIPERYGYIADNLVTFQKGVPWLHNTSGARNTFYGVKFSSRVKCLVNPFYSNDKIFKALGIESNKSWEVSMTTPAGQQTSIPADKFKNRKDHRTADLYRDINTPAAIMPSGASPYLQGREMSGPSIEVTLENSDADHTDLRYLDMRYVVVSGNLLVNPSK